MTRDAEVDFLQWALPRLGLRWAGFRRVRGQVGKRLRRRLDALGLEDLDAYKAYLDTHREEWDVLDGLTHVTISRFYRDRAVFDMIEHAVLPALAAGRDRLKCWSAGCASGEEPYTLALMSRVHLDIVATDIDRTMLDRASTAEYPPSSLRELPAGWRERGFARRNEVYVLRAEYRRAVTFRRHDLRTRPPHTGFDLVLCRNVAFTYLAVEEQRVVLGYLAAALRPGGALVIGLHEDLPQTALGFEPWPDARAVFRLTA